MFFFHKITKCILFLARPTDPTTINYFIEIGKILSGETTMDPDEKSDILSDVLTALNVTEKQLQDCIGKNIRITVRQIMKMKYPNPRPGFKFATVDRDHVAAARGENNYSLSLFNYIYMFI
jgi:hypothetical protein